MTRAMRPIENDLRGVVAGAVESAGIWAIAPSLFASKDDANVRKLPACTCAALSLRDTHLLTVPGGWLAGDHGFAAVQPAGNAHAVADVPRSLNRYLMRTAVVYRPHEGAAARVAAQRRRG